MPGSAHASIPNHASSVILAAPPNSATLCPAIQVRGRIVALHPAGHAAAAPGRRGHSQGPAVDLKGKMVLPCFADLHTHIGEAMCSAPALIARLLHFGVGWRDACLLVSGSPACSGMVPHGACAHPAPPLLPVRRQGPHHGAQPQPKRQPQRGGPQHCTGRGILG